MGRMLGAFDGSDELDRADLNKCPDCGCFFPQLNCPFCGKECPEEMRAGNRAPVKKTKKKRSSSSRNVIFIDWYHRWWFIILMLFFFPVIGIILLVTSPHKKAVKITVFSVAVVYTFVTTFGVGTIIQRITNIWDKPVDTSLSREEYVSICEVIDAEDYYRRAESYKDKYISVTLTVKDKVIDSDGYYAGDKYCTYYICSDTEGNEFEIMIRDCVQDVSANYISGDVITVYGEGAGNKTIYDLDSYESYTEPCIHVAYVSEDG